MDDRIEKAWETISYVPHFLDNFIKVNGDETTIDIDYEEFEPDIFELDVTSLSNYNKSLKKCMAILKQGFIDQGYNVELNYTHSPFSKNSYTDVQMQIKLTDKKTDDAKNRMGKFKDLLDI